MQPNFSQLSFRNNKRELFQMRNQRFSKKRKIDQKMEQEQEEKHVESIEDIDYSGFYSIEARMEIDLSLKMDIPAQLPPLDLNSISLYRRSGQSVYQTRRIGSKQIDPHMAYQSLLMLGHNDCQNFGNWTAIVRQFQRDLKIFLSMQSKDIRQMAIIAAGNKILGKQEDILNLIKDGNTQFLWVLINHTYQDKISSKYILPFFLHKNQLAFKTFSQLTGNMRDQSIMILADSDEAIDCLIDVLCQPTNLCKLSLKIISNMLGQGQGYWKYFYHSKLLQKIVQLLSIIIDNSMIDNIFKLTIIEMLCAFVSQNQAANAVLRHDALMSILLKMLNIIGSWSIDIRRQLLNTFSFIVYKAQPQEVFHKLMNAQIIQICSSILGMNQDLNLSSLQLICGLVQLGQKFIDENGQNIASILIKSNGMLESQIQEYCMSKNNYVSGLSITIVEKMEGISQEL